METIGLELNDSDADIRKSSSSIVSRIYVEGYDTSLSGYDLVMSMRKHFASCGEVLHVYIPGYVEGYMLNRFVLIYLRGEGAEEKASRLNGSCMGGHELVVEPYPFHATHLDHKFPPMRKSDNLWSSMIYVDGYDTSLAEDYVKSKLVEHLSQCGRVLGVDIPKVNGDVLFREAFVTVIGIDTIEKAMQLGGCDVKGLENVKVSGVANPSKDGESTGNMIPLRYWTDGSSSTPVMPPGDPNLPQPPDLATLRSHPWYSRFDERAGLFRIWNKETGIQYDLPPSPASKVGYASEDPSLPKPWKVLVDLSTGYKYFWNTETNVTQYKRPPPSQLHQ